VSEPDTATRNERERDNVAEFLKSHDDDDAAAALATFSVFKMEAKIEQIK